MTLQDNSTHRAVLVGQGIETDIALVEIEALRPLPAVVFGDSRAIRPGEPVLAIGNPLGLGGSVSAGIVSAVDRDIGEGTFGDFIQTDAAINHGNSGGPLFNAGGEVVGMNTAIFTPRLKAAPSGWASRSRPATCNSWGSCDGTAASMPGWLGIQVQRLTRGIVEATRLTQPATGIVSDVDSGGPAAEAGVQPGDVIIGCTDHGVVDAGSFLLRVEMLEPGHHSGLLIWRYGQEVTLPIVVQERPAMRGAPTQPPPVEVRMDAEAFELSMR